MANKLIQSIIPVLTGGSTAVNVESNCDTVHIKPAAGITLSSALNITVSGTPIKNTEITFIYGGLITTDTATGKSVNIFGTELTNAQALYEGEIKAYYNGSAWEIKVFPDSESGLSNLDGSGIVTGSIATAALADDAVTNDKLNSMTRGTVKVGGTSNTPTDLDAKTSGNVLVGDGTDVNSVAISGDITLSSAGVTAIGAGKVTNAMLATPPQTYYQLKRTITSAEVLSMNSTPINIISAPGSGKVIKILTGFVWVDYNTATYASGGQLELRFGSDIMGTAAVGSITTATDLLSNLYPIAAATTSSLNQALLLSNVTADFTTGDSEVKIILYYTIDDFN